MSGILASDRFDALGLRVIPCALHYTPRSLPSGLDAAVAARLCTGVLFGTASAMEEQDVWYWEGEEAMQDEQRPRVGVGVMVLKGNKVLIGKRKGSHGEGEWAWPGGHMEYMESFEDCAKREVREETGIEITNIRFLRLMNVKQYAPKHYVDIGLVADWRNGDPSVLEPERVETWEWRDMDTLPQPLFATLPSYIEAYRKGRTFWDG